MPFKFFFKNDKTLSTIMKSEDQIEQYKNEESGAVVQRTFEDLQAQNFYQDKEAMLRAQKQRLKEILENRLQNKEMYTEKEMELKEAAPQPDLVKKPGYKKRKARKNAYKAKMKELNALEKLDPDTALEELKNLELNLLQSEGYQTEDAVYEATVAKYEFAKLRQEQISGEEAPVKNLEEYYHNHSKIRRIFQDESAVQELEQQLQTRYEELQKLRTEYEAIGKAFPEDLKEFFRPLENQGYLACETVAQKRNYLLKNYIHNTKWNAFSKYTNEDLMAQKHAYEEELQRKEAEKKEKERLEREEQERKEAKQREKARLAVKELRRKRKLEKISQKKNALEKRFLVLKQSLEKEQEEKKEKEITLRETKKIDIDRMAEEKLLVFSMSPQFQKKKEVSFCYSDLRVKDEAHANETLERLGRCEAARRIWSEATSKSARKLLLTMFSHGMRAKDIKELIENKGKAQTESQEIYSRDYRNAPAYTREAFDALFTQTEEETERFGKIDLLEEFPELELCGLQDEIYSVGGYGYRAFCGDETDVDLFTKTYQEISNHVVSEFPSYLLELDEWKDDVIWKDRENTEIRQKLMDMLRPILARDISGHLSMKLPKRIEQVKKLLGDCTDFAQLEQKITALNKENDARIKRLDEYKGGRLKPIKDIILQDDRRLKNLLIAEDVDALVETIEHQAEKFLDFYQEKGGSYKGVKAFALKHFMMTYSDEIMTGNLSGIVSSTGKKYRTWQAAFEYYETSLYTNERAGNESALKAVNELLAEYKDSDEGLFASFRYQYDKRREELFAEWYYDILLAKDQYALLYSKNQLQEMFEKKLAIRKENLEYIKKLEEANPGKEEQFSHFRSHRSQYLFEKHQKSGEMRRDIEYYINHEYHQFAREVEKSNRRQKEQNVQLEKTQQRKEAGKEAETRLFGQLSEVVEGEISRGYLPFAAITFENYQEMSERDKRYNIEQANKFIEVHEQEEPLSDFMKSAIRSIYVQSGCGGEPDLGGQEDAIDAPEIDFTEAEDMAKNFLAVRKKINEIGGAEKEIATLYMASEYIGKNQKELSKMEDNPIYQTFQTYMERISEINQSSFQNEEIEAEKLDFVKECKKLIVASRNRETITEEKLFAYIENKKAYLERMDEMYRILKESLKESKITSQYTKEIKARMLLGFRAYYVGELLDEIEQKKAFDLEAWKEKIRTDIGGFDDTTSKEVINEKQRFVSQIAGANLSSDDYARLDNAQLGVVSRQDFEREFEISQHPRKADMEKVSKEPTELEKQYAKLSDGMKQVFAEAVLLYHSRNKEYADNVYLNMGMSDAWQGNQELVMKKLNKFIHHQMDEEDLSLAIDYKQVQNILIQDKEINEDIFKEAIQFTETMQAMREYHREKDWERMSGTAEAAMAGALCSEDQHISGKKMSERLISFQGIQFRDAIQVATFIRDDLLGQKVSKKDTTIRKLAELIEQKDEKAIRLLLQVLKDRSILDVSDSDGLFRQVISGQTIHVNDEKRSEMKSKILKKELEEEDDQELFRNALVTLHSYKLKENVVFGEELKESDISEKARERTTMIDLELLSQAFSFVEEIRQDEAKKELLSHAKDVIEKSGNEKAIELIQLTERRSHFLENDFTGTLINEAKKDKEAVKDATMLMEGYLTLDENQKRLFIHALQDRSVLDISKRNLYRNMAGLQSVYQEREFANVEGRDLLTEKYLDSLEDQNQTLTVGETELREAFRSLCSTQIDDSIELQKGEIKIEELMAGEKYFLFRRDTAIDWKLLRRALEYVHTVTREKELYDRNQKISLFMQEKKMKADVVAFSRNTHRTLGWSTKFKEGEADEKANFAADKSGGMRVLGALTRNLFQSELEEKQNDRAESLDQELNVAQKVTELYKSGKENVEALFGLTEKADVGTQMSEMLTGMISENLFDTVVQRIEGITQTKLFEDDSEMRDNLNGQIKKRVSNFLAGKNVDGKAEQNAASQIISDMAGWLNREVKEELLLIGVDVKSYQKQIDQWIGSAVDSVFSKSMQELIKNTDQVIDGISILGDQFTMAQSIYRYVTTYSMISETKEKVKKEEAANQERMQQRLDSLKKEGREKADGFDDKEATEILKSLQTNQFFVNRLGDEYVQNSQAQKMIKDVTKAIGTTAGYMMGDPLFLGTIAGGAAEVVNSIRRMFKDSKALKEYVNSENGPGHEILEKYKASRERSMQQAGGEYSRLELKELFAENDKLYGSLEDEKGKTVDRVRVGCGFDGDNQFLAQIGLEMSQAILFSASRYNPSKTEQIMAVCMLSIIDATDCIGRMDRASIERVFRKMMQ